MVRLETQSETLDMSRNNIGMQRFIIRGDNGEVSIHNGGFYINRDQQGQNVGTKALIVQAEAAARLGVDSISTTAERDHQLGAFGYNVWPHRGFDGLLQQQTVDALPSEIRQSLPNDESIRISHLLQSEEGQKWWRENGDQIKLRFDLTPPDNYSTQTLRNYTGRRGILDE